MASQDKLVHQGWVSLKKEADVFCRTAFIVFVMVFNLSCSSSPRTWRSLTFPALRDVRSSLIRALFYFFPLRMVINCGSSVLGAGNSFTIQMRKVYFVKFLGGFNTFY